MEEPALESPVSSQTVQFPTVATNSRWQARKPSNNFKTAGRRRSRAKSFSEHTQDAVKVVAPPISVKLVLLCGAWYLASAVSSNLSKGILQIFAYPVTLTMVQFIYAALFSSAALFLAHKSSWFNNLFPKNTVANTGVPDLRPGNLDMVVIKSVVPMAMFQIAGHILSHSATSRIPVSLVHAIKSLSPLLTVAVYTFVFKFRYNASTYLSLVPLTAGVIMSCAAEFRARPLAIFYAFMSCVVFVAQNIWSKGLLTTGKPADASETSTRKIDKVSIIFWCAVVGFLGTAPIWLLSDGLKMAMDGVELRNGGSLAQFLVLATLNGFSHVCQNLLSFMILGSISTVAYSIASLLKRVFVMSAAIVWFGQAVTGAQGWGIIITFVGLYIYDRFGSRTEQSALPK